MKTDKTNLRLSFFVALTAFVLFVGSIAPFPIRGQQSNFPAGGGATSASVATACGGVSTQLVMISGTACQGTNGVGGSSVTYVTNGSGGMELVIGGATGANASLEVFNSSSNGAALQIGGSGAVNVFNDGHAVLSAYTNVPTAVSGLPAVAGAKGWWITVNDSTTVAAEGQTCVGGSSNQALAFSNGTIWKCF